MRLRHRSFEEFGSRFAKPESAQVTIHIDVSLRAFAHFLGGAGGRLLAHRLQTPLVSEDIEPRLGGDRA